MYSAWPHAETSRAYSQHDRSTSYFNEQPTNHGHPQVATQPPRPLEPRPILHTSLSDSMGSLRTQEAYRYPEGPSPEHRYRSHNLPGVKDILNPSPYSPTHTSYSATWNSSTGPSTSQQDNEGYRSLNGIHPPMVLHPPVSANQRYHPPLDQFSDLPGLEANRQTQVPALSPTSVHPDRIRDYAETHPERPKHASTGSLLSNGVPSPYSNVAADENDHRTPAAASYRQGRTGHPVTGAETHGKYLGVEDVAGEGKFHVYADGYRIPTQVDGEQVNPAWGLTKANKPRKRLALACLDCREKKIKCEPGANSCIQCEKAMRPCRKAPEKYSNTDTTSNYFVGSPVRKSASGSDTTPSLQRIMDPDLIAKRRSRADPSPPFESNKRHRSISPRSNNAHDTDQLRRDDNIHTDAGVSDAITATRQEPLMWENDPYAVEPDLTLHLLNVYFDHINNATDCIFPREHFLRWLKDYTTKCQNEKLLLYAMLAAASIYAEEGLSGFGKQCAQIAGDAIASEVGRFNVAAAQSKLLLAMYHFAKGSHEVAWDHIGAAIRIVTFLNLNTEEGCQNDEESKSQKRYEFAYSPEQLAECKRRIFWSCFLQDRYCGTTMCTIKPQDVFVRLPCADDMYERSIASDAPFFPNGIIDPEATPVSPCSPLAPMAWLVLVAAIWGDVIDFTFRASRRPNITYRESYESFYSKTQNRAQDWLSKVPEHLQYNEANLNQSIQQGYAGTFVSMHALYHLSLIKLNRYMRHAVIPHSVSRNIRTANHHGHQILQIMTALNFARREVMNSEGQPAVFAFSTPFPGYAISSAIDIVSAGGLDSNLGATLDEMDGALGCLRELSDYWNSSKDQLRACRKRFYQLKNITITPKTAKSGCWLGRKWGIKRPLEQDFAPENDCIYGLGEQEADEAMGKYFDAFKDV